MEYKVFLGKVSEKLSGIKADSKANVYGQYNIFDVLGVGSKEVIVCRFLADLLNPKGKHGCGTMFLKRFMNELGDGYNNYDNSVLESTTVETEHLIDGDRRIDIVIFSKEFFIPMEVKIYAEEQENQSFDYYNYVKKRNGNKLVYLTHYGSSPSDYST